MVGGYTRLYTTLGMVGEVYTRLYTTLGMVERYTPWYTPPYTPWVYPATYRTSRVPVISVLGVTLPAEEALGSKRRIPMGMRRTEPSRTLRV